MILGIDPGVKGGMALLDDRGSVVNTCMFNGLKDAELAVIFREWRKYAGALAYFPAFIEKVGHIKGDGAGGSFTFGRVYGLLRGLALGNGYTIHDVYPVLWQSTLGCMSGGNKNVTKGKAVELFPQYHDQVPRGIGHGIADALLIAEYGRRIIARRTE